MEAQHYPARDYPGEEDLIIQAPEDAERESGVLSGATVFVGAVAVTSALRVWDISAGLFQRFRDNVDTDDDYAASQSDSLQFHGK